VRIALVIFRSDPARGGAERYTTDLAAALAARGLQPTIVSSAFDDSPAEGVARARMDCSAPTRAAAYFRFLNGVERWVEAARPDLVHAMLPIRRCDLYHPHAGIAAEEVAAGHRLQANPIARALTWLGNRLNRKRNAFARVERAMLEADPPPLVLCLSEYIRSALDRHYHLPDSSKVALVNGVDLARFDPAAENPDPLARFGIGEECVVALLVAQDFSRKGVAEAIAAVAAAGDPRLRLVVVGGDDSRPLRDAIRAARMGGRVVFTGPADPRPFYQYADFFILPTRHDPCSLVLLEALAMGMPCITTRQNGAAQVMTHGVHGFVVDSQQDAAGLAAAVKGMLDEPVRERMRQACRELRPSLRFESHVEKLLEAYRLAVARRQGGARGARGDASGSRGDAGETRHRH